MRGSCTVGGQRVSFGYFGFGDWLNATLLSFGAPWSVAPNDGKYYGTVIVDATGRPILRVWQSSGVRSPRECPEMSDAEWGEYCCDGHWESAVAFHLASAVVAARNAVSPDYVTDNLSVLRSLIVEHFEWDECVWEMVRVGGPHRRYLPTDPEIEAEVPHLLRRRPKL